MKKIQSKLHILLDLPLFLINYLFIVICAKALKLDEFGAFNSFLAAMSVVFVFGVSLQISAAKLPKKAYKTVLYPYCLFSVTTALAISLTLDFSLIAHVSLCVIGITHPIYSVIRGQCICKADYRSYYKSIYLEMFAKMAALVFLIYFENKFDFLVVTAALSQSLTLLHAVSSRPQRFIVEKINLESFLSIDYKMIVNQVGFFLIIGFDFFILRMFFIDQSGHASLSIRFCQIPLLLLFTYLQFDIKKVASKKRLTATSMKYFAAIAILFGANNLLLQLFGNQIVEVFFGKKSF